MIESLQNTFRIREQDPQHRLMLDNLAIVVDAHDANPIKPNKEQERLALAFQNMSSVEVQGGIAVDRTFEELASMHDLPPDQLIDFAAGGTVVDVGAGRSSFLDHFRGDSRTIAVDRHSAHVAYQEENFHEGIVARAHDLHDIPTASVRLAHASFSAPYWSASTTEAQKVAAEYVRVLEPGGIALVGPITRGDLHMHYEHFVESTKYNGRENRPWPIDRDDQPYLSRTLCAFTGVVLAKHAQEDAEIELAGQRTIFGRERDYYANASVLHVPNFLMIRKK